MGKTVIIGAGLAGLSAGYHAQMKEMDYDLYEAETVVGGACRTIERKGFYFDYSGHLLHLKDPYFQQLVRELLADNLNVIARNAVIHSHGVYTRYPFQANLYGLPPVVVKDCLLEFVKAYYANKDMPTSSYRTFADWIFAKLGAGIGRHFMFPYNEKLWTVPTEKITCDWLSEYVPKPNLEDVFDGAFSDQKKGFGYNATFWYPKRGGIQALSNAIAARIPNLHMNEKATNIDPVSKTVMFASGKHSSYEKLITTVPLNQLMRMLSNLLPDAVAQAVGKLRHNSVLIVNLGVRGARLTDRHWVYLPEKKYTAYRVGCYSNISDQLAQEGMSSFYVEIAYRKEWNVDKEELVAKAIHEMVEIGLIRKLEDIIIKDVADLECAYVIYDENHAESRRTIKGYLAGLGIASIGRYGNWEYSGMEEAMIQGKMAVEGLNSTEIT